MDETNYSGYQNPRSPYGNKDNPSDQDYDQFNKPTSAYTKKDDNPATQAGAGFGNGVNLQPSYSNGGNADLGWSLMKENKKIQTVRIEIEPGQETNAKRWIKEALDNEYKVIATYHKSSVLASDDMSELQKAAQWWQANYNELKKNGAFTINLMNEWGSHVISSNDYASAYNKAIATVRSVYANPIIIDIPGYGQETLTAVDAVKGTTGTMITDKNIILSFHIYPGAWNQRRNRGLTNGDLDEMASTGLTCMVGEFGNKSISKPATSWSSLVDYAKSKGWPIIGWAWGGDNTMGNGSSQNMNMLKSENMEKIGTFEPYSPGNTVQYSKSNYFETVYEKL